MSARELAIVLLRVVALYLLINFVTALPAALWALGYLLTSLLTGYFTISSSSTSKTSVAPGLIFGGAPRSP